MSSFFAVARDAADFSIKRTFVRCHLSASSRTLPVASLLLACTLFAATPAAAAGPATAPATAPAPVTIRVTAPELIKCPLTLSPFIVSPREADANAIGGTTVYFNHSECIERKPPLITKEPAYVGRPRYGVFAVGNGPRSRTDFVVDEAPGFAGKFYVDVNQNGDLTDDGPGDWETYKTDDISRNCLKTIAVHGSWGSTVEEKESGQYTLWVTKRDGNAGGVGFVRTTARTGMLPLGGKRYPIVVSDTMSDGIFTVPADADLTRAPVMLYIDTENAVPFEADTPAPTTGPVEKRVPTKFDIGHPFQIDGHWYFARPSVSGATLTVQETTAPDAVKPSAVPPEKAPVGSVAPDFTIETPDGRPLRLADFKGKLVILDFWATWCGPCQQSMPGLEKLYQRVRDQDVVVLSVCVQDEKQAFDAWIAEHANTDYHFTFGFDPAGKADTSLATETYGVPAVPAWFLITRDGKVAAKNVGYDGTENKLIRALQGQSVKVAGVVGEPPVKN